MHLRLAACEHFLFRRVRGLQERVMTIPYESSKNNDELGTQYPDAIFAVRFWF